MPDTKPTKINSQASDLPTEAPQLLELVEILKKGGISNESASYLAGKFAREISDRLTAEILTACQDVPSLRNITDPVVMAGEMQKIFEQKMHITTDERRVQIAQDLLNEFKAAGTAKN